MSGRMLFAAVGRLVHSKELTWQMAEDLLLVTP